MIVLPFWRLWPWKLVVCFTLHCSNMLINHKKESNSIYFLYSPSLFCFLAKRSRFTMCSQFWNLTQLEYPALQVSPCSVFSTCNKLYWEQNWSQLRQSRKSALKNKNMKTRTKWILKWKEDFLLSVFWDISNNWSN